MSGQNDQHVQVGRRRSHPFRGIVGVLSILIAKSLGALPLPMAHAVARCAARLIFMVPRLQRIGMENLKLAFGDTLNDSERKRIFLESIENITTVAAEFTRTARLKGDFLHDRVSVEGAEYLPQDRCGIAIGGHMGNWEWLAPSRASEGWKASAIVRPLDNPLLDAFVDRIRTHTGTVTIPKRNAQRTVIELLQQGYLVGILADQSPRRNAVPVTFFGRPCWATIGPVMLAMRAKVPIFGVAMIRKPDGRYILRFTPEIEMVRTENLRQDLVENTQRCQDVIEKIIRENPGQWLWLHRRWKKRPNLEAEWNERLAREGESGEGGKQGA